METEIIGPRCVFRSVDTRHGQSVDRRGQIKRRAAQAFVALETLVCGRGCGAGGHPGAWRESAAPDEIERRRHFTFAPRADVAPRRRRFRPPRCEHLRAPPRGWSRGRVSPAAARTTGRSGAGDVTPELACPGMGQFDDGRCSRSLRCAIAGGDPGPVPGLPSAFCDGAPPLGSPEVWNAFHRPWRSITRGPRRRKSPASPKPREGAAPLAAAFSQRNRLRRYGNDRFVLRNKMPTHHS